jgi:uncharacterized cysteine cluster protein YcgN (CxxCxxCC family)
MVERLENQEFRTHVLWQAVEKVRLNSDVNRCRYVAEQQTAGAKCARLCLAELEDVSQMPSTQRYQKCLDCLAETATPMPYAIHTGTDLSLDQLVEALQAVHEAEAALRELEQ